MVASFSAAAKKPVGWRYIESWFPPDQEIVQDRRICTKIEDHLSSQAEQGLEAQNVPSGQGDLANCINLFYGLLCALSPYFFK